MAACCFLQKWMLLSKIWKFPNSFKLILSVITMLQHFLVFLIFRYKKDRITRTPKSKRMTQKTKKQTRTQKFNDVCSLLPMQASKYGTTQMKTKSKKRRCGPDNTLCWSRKLIWKQRLSKCVASKWKSVERWMAGAVDSNTMWHILQHQCREHGAPSYKFCTFVMMY